WMRFLENAALSGLLADEMGLGKTRQTLTWLSLPHGADARSGARDPALIVCPTSLVRNWEAEAKKFTPWLKTLVVSGPGRAGDFARIPEADLVVTSYALLQRDFEDAYLGRRFAAVVLDEAQHIKNRQTKNAKAVKMLDAARRLVLTGTPVENSVADVWSIFDFLMPGYLGDYETFKANFEDPIAEGGAAGEEAQARLRRKLHPFILRRLKKTVAKDLPDKIVKVSHCPMDEDAQRDYNEALAATRRQAGDAIREKGLAKSRFEILAMLMKLRQIASRAKLAAFLEQLESAIAGGHKILVFSQFVKMLGAIAGELKARGVPFCYLDGSTRDRLGECNRFNRSPEIPVFLVSLMAGGTGLNLTGADMVIHYDPWWNPAVEDQATDRAHRIGQKKTVYVVKMIAAGSIEEKVLALQRRKQAVISATVSTTDEAVMERLTADDLAALLS
ncbi:MAG: DEAD/DEAH box helicase, partial [Kiritimatiellae bacterium]|nr:DEAD/DEAH box helicase [Kiritimatiellia bacterium]